MLVTLLALLTASCQVLCTGQERPRPPHSPAGSKSPSPSHSKSASPPHEPQGTKLFGVVLHEGPKQPARSEHPNQSLHTHRAHQGQTPAQHTQSIPSHVPTHAVRMHSIQHLKSTPSPQFKRLGRIGAELHPAPMKPMRRPVVSESSSPKQRVKWWQKAGGKPARPHGAGPHYEEHKKYREKKKSENKQEKHTDEHPSGHQQHPPKGGGPGSPGAGSSVVGKRRLEDSEYPQAFRPTRCMFRVNDE